MSFIKSKRGISTHDGKNEPDMYRLLKIVLVSLLTISMATSGIPAEAMAWALTGTLGTADPTKTDPAKTGKADASKNAASTASGELGSDDAKQTTKQNAPAEAQSTAKVLSRKFTNAVGKYYEVELRYGDAAGIPDGSQLRVVQQVETPADIAQRPEAYADRPYEFEEFVAKSQLDEQSRAVDRMLALGEDGYRFYSDFLSLHIEYDGQDIVPQAAVEVRVTTNAVEASASDAVEAVVLTSQGAAELGSSRAATLATEAWWQDLAKGGRPVTDYFAVPTVRNATGDYTYDAQGNMVQVNPDNRLTTVAFDTQEITQIALAGVVAPLSTRSVNDVVVEVLGPRAGFEAQTQATEALAPLEGYRILDAFGVQLHQTDESSQIRGEQAMNRAREARERLGLGQNAPPLVEPGYDLDYGLRAWVRVRRADPSQSADGLASWSVENGGYADTRKAGNAEPLSIRADKQTVAVGLAQKAAQTEDDAEGANTLRNELAAATGIGQDSHTLEATSTTGANSVGVQLVAKHSWVLPEGVQLQVRELEGAEAKAYMAQTKDVLGAQTGYFRAFDISLVGPGGVEYEPTDRVAVTIDLNDKHAPQGAQVLHFTNDDQVQAVDAKQSGDSIGFTTDGFSVYVVVDTAEKQYIQEGVGYYISMYSNGNTGRYVSNVEATAGSDNGLKKVGSLSEASKFYFEKADTNYYMYTYDAESQKRYVYSPDNNSSQIALSEVGENPQTLRAVTLTPKETTGVYSIKVNDGRWFNEWGGTKGSILAGWTEDNCPLLISETGAPPASKDPLHLDGQEYALVSPAKAYDNNQYGIGSTVITKSGSVSGLQPIQVVPGTSDTGKATYETVDSSQALPFWHFEALDDGTYYMSTQVNGQTRYLNIAENKNVTLEDTTQPLRLSWESSGSRISIRRVGNGKTAALDFYKSEKDKPIRFSSYNDVTTAENRQYILVAPAVGMIYYEYTQYVRTGAADEEDEPQNKDGNLRVHTVTDQWHQDQEYEGYNVLEPEQPSYTSGSDDYIWEYTFDHWHDASVADPAQGNYYPGGGASGKIMDEPQQPMTLRSVWRFERKERPVTIQYVIDKASQTETVYGYQTSDGTVYNKLPRLLGKQESEMTDEVILSEGSNYSPLALVANNYYAVDGKVYRFAGWKLNNTDTTLEAGAPIVVDEKIGDDYRYYDTYRHVTLTAKWELDKTVSTHTIYNWIVPNTTKVPDGLGYRFGTGDYANLTGAYVVDRTRHNNAPADARVSIDDPLTAIEIGKVTQDFDVIGKYDSLQNTGEAVSGNKQYRFMVALNDEWQRLSRPYYTDLLQGNDAGTITGKGISTGTREVFLNSYLGVVYAPFFNSAYTAANQIGHVFGHGDINGTSYNRLSVANMTQFFQSSTGVHYLLYTPAIPSGASQTGEINFSVANDACKNQSFYTIGISDELKSEYGEGELSGVVSGKDVGGNFELRSLAKDDMYETASFPEPNVVGYRGRKVSVTVKAPASWEVGEKVVNTVYLRGKDGTIVEYGAYNADDHTYTFVIDSLTQPFEAVASVMHTVSVHQDDVEKIQITGAESDGTVVAPKLSDGVVRAKEKTGMLVRVSLDGVSATDALCVKFENGIPITGTGIAYDAQKGGFTIPADDFVDDYGIMTRETFARHRGYRVVFQMDLPDGLKMSQVFGKLPGIEGLEGYSVVIPGEEAAGYVLPDMQETAGSGKSYFTTLLSTKYAFERFWETEWGDRIEVSSEVDFLAHPEFCQDGRLVLKPIWIMDAEDPLGLNGHKFVLVNQVKNTNSYVGMTTSYKESSNNPKDKGLDKDDLSRQTIDGIDLFKPNGNSKNMVNTWEFEAVEVDGEPYYKIFTYVGGGTKKYLSFNPAKGFASGGDTVLVDEAANVKVEHAPLEVKGLYPYFLRLDDENKTYLDYFSQRGQVFSAWSFNGEGQPSDEQLEGDALIKKLEEVYKSGSDDGVTGFLNGNRWLIFGEPLYDLPIHVAMEKVADDGTVTYVPIEVTANGRIFQGDDVLGDRKTMEVTLGGITTNSLSINSDLISTYLTNAVKEQITQNMSRTSAGENVPFVAIAGNAYSWSGNATVDIDRSKQATYVRMDVGGLRYSDREGAEGTLITSDQVGGRKGTETVNREYPNGLALYVVCRQKGTMMLDVSKEWTDHNTGQPLSVSASDGNSATMELHRRTKINGEYSASTETTVDTVTFPYNGKWTKSYPLPAEDSQGNPYGYYVVETDCSVNTAKYEKTEASYPTSIQDGNGSAVNENQILEGEKDGNKKIVVSNKVKKYATFNVRKDWNVVNNAELLEQLGCSELANPDDLEIDVEIFEVSKANESANIASDAYTNQASAERLKDTLESQGYTVAPYKAASDSGRYVLNKGNNWNLGFIVDSARAYYAVERAVRTRDGAKSWGLEHFEVGYAYTDRNDEEVVNLTNNFDPIARVMLENGTWHYYSKLVSAVDECAFGYANDHRESANTRIELLYGSHNRYALQRFGTSYGFEFGNGSNITIAKFDGVSAETSTVSRRYYPNAVNQALLRVAGGTALTLDDVTLTRYRDNYAGCLAYVNDATLTLTGNTLLTGGVCENGGSVYVNAGTLNMDSDAAIRDSAARSDGGAVYVRSGAMNVRGNAKVQNNHAGAKGGGVCVAGTSVLTVSGGTIAANTSVGDGAGVYLAKGSTCNLSGNPDFGGVGANDDALDTNAGNFSATSLPANATNGRKSYGRARQDIFLEGAADDGVTLGTLVVTGKLTDPADAQKTMPAGSIWVWAKDNPHYLADGQFALVAQDYYEREGNDLEDVLKAFRNARDDETTENPNNDTYLYGVQGEGRQVVWGPVSRGSRKVILRKVAAQGEGYESLQGAEFMIYRSNWKPYDGITYRSDATTGVYFVGDLPYGTYYVMETKFPEGYGTTGNRYYTLVVSETGQEITNE